MTSELGEVDRQLATLRRTLMCLKSGSPGLTAQLDDRLHRLMRRRDELLAKGEQQR
jgi:hypothetical protein